MIQEIADATARGFVVQFAEIGGTLPGEPRGMQLRISKGSYCRETLFERSLLSRLREHVVPEEIARAVAVSCDSIDNAIDVDQG